MKNEDIKFPTIGKKYRHGVFSDVYEVLAFAEDVSDKVPGCASVVSRNQDGHMFIQSLNQWSPVIFQECPDPTCETEEETYNKIEQLSEQLALMLKTREPGLAMWRELLLERGNAMHEHLRRLGICKL